MKKILFVCHGSVLGTVISGDEVREIGTNCGRVIDVGTTVFIRMRMAK